MNIDHFIPSVLHVTASEELNIEKDLVAEQTKTIAEFLQQENNETKEDKTTKENKEENSK
jgi:hypothetical protein